MFHPSRRFVPIDEPPEPLIARTVQTAARVRRGQLVPSQVMSRRAAWLVQEAMRALAQKRWRLVPLLFLVLSL